METLDSETWVRVPRKLTGLRPNIEGAERIFIVVDRFFLLPCTLDTTTCWQLIRAYQLAGPGGGELYSQFTIDHMKAEDLVQLVGAGHVPAASSHQDNLLVGCALVNQITAAYPNVGYEVNHQPFGVVEEYSPEVMKALGVG